MLTEIIGTINN